MKKSCLKCFSYSRSCHMSHLWWVAEESPQVKTLTFQWFFLAKRGQAPGSIGMQPSYWQGFEQKLNSINLKRSEHMTRHFSIISNTYFLQCLFGILMLHLSSLDSFTCYTKIKRVDVFDRTREWMWDARWWYCMWTSGRRRADLPWVMPIYFTVSIHQIARYMIQWSFFLEDSPAMYIWHRTIKSFS
jgi:hypothetical protein